MTQIADTDFAADWKAWHEAEDLDGEHIRVAGDQIAEPFEERL